MMTKEEYKKTLIRMWDSVRDNGFKGSASCEGVHCDPERCPIKSFCGNRMIDYYEVIEFVEKWGKEHPIETNGSKFLKNYPKSGIDYEDSESVDIRLNVSNPYEGVIKFPKIWWESEVDDK